MFISFRLNSTGLLHEFNLFCSFFRTITDNPIPNYQHNLIFLVHLTTVIWSMDTHQLILKSTNSHSYIHIFILEITSNINPTPLQIQHGNKETSILPTPNVSETLCIKLQRGLHIPTPLIIIKNSV